MNPFTGSIKYFIANLYNSLLALLFFILLARYLTPSYLGQIALVQLIAYLTTSVFALLPGNLIMRDIAYDFTSKKDLRVAEVSLFFTAVILPFMLVFLVFPKYVWISIPYFILTLLTSYQSWILSGLGKFTEANLGVIISSTFRYGLAIAGVLMRNIYIIIAFWTAGAALAAIYYSLQVSIKPKWHFDVFKSLVMVGLPIYISGIVGFIAGQGDRLVTYALLGSYYLGIYQLMAMISTVPNLLISSLSSAILPASTHYYAKGKDMVYMSSLSFRFYTLISLPLALIGLALSYPVVYHLFPAYLPGVKALEILILFVTATMPFISLSTFMISAKKDYKPFVLIGSISAVEVVGVSYLLIPRYNVFGAAVAQAINALITSALFLFFSIRQKVFVLDKKNYLTIFLILISFFGLLSWEIALIAVLIGIKALGIINKDDVTILERFSPKQLKTLIDILKIFAR